MDQTYFVAVTPQAQEHIRNIAYYVAYQLLNPNAAHRLVDKLEEAIASLSLFPHRIALTEEEPWHSAGIHKMIVEKYLVYFWIDEESKTVRVTAVVFASRNQRRALEQLTDGY